MRLIENWHRKIFRLHSMRVAIGGALFWGAISGVIMIWPALSDWLPTWLYAVGGVFFCALFAAARLLKQPGAE